MGYQWKKMNMVFLWLHLQVFLVNLPETEKITTPEESDQKTWGFCRDPIFGQAKFGFITPVNKRELDCARIVIQSQTNAEFNP